MLTVVTARSLRDRGLAWTPASGDRFVVADRGMDDVVFVVSEMVIEYHRSPSGEMLRFNGTTEWALDQIEVKRVLWLPREDQLRAALGERFVALSRWAGHWVVTTSDGAAHEHEDVEEAYAAALLAGAAP